MRRTAQRLALRGGADQDEGEERARRGRSAEAAHVDRDDAIAALEGRAHRAALS